MTRPRRVTGPQLKLFGGKKATAARDQPTTRDSYRAEAQPPTAMSSPDQQLFTGFLNLLEQVLNGNARTFDELIDRTGLVRSQLRVWLEQAESAGIVRKLSRPARYELAPDTGSGPTRPSRS